MKKVLISLCTVAVVGLASAVAQAGILEIDDPGGTTTEMGARIRWGGSGFEASIFDSAPSGPHTPTLNPGGSPVWGLGNQYGFMVTFDPLTGTLGLSVDFNRDSRFGGGESIARSVFSTPPRTDYTGHGFRYLSIVGNETGSTARSNITNLVINGTSFSSLTPNGIFLEQYYKDSSGNPIAPIAITGDLTFVTAGTSQERPSWNFNFKDSAPSVPVPEPAPLIICSLFGALGVGVARWQRKRAR
jgi:hypothetical protein